jgi:heme-degrading monooxygenase HmoA
VQEALNAGLMGDVRRWPGFFKFFKLKEGRETREYQIVSLSI